VAEGVRSGTDRQSTRPDTGSEGRHRHRGFGFRSHAHERSARCAGGVPLAPMAPVRRQAGPCPPALYGQELLLVERDVMLAQTIDCPSPCVGADRQRLALAVSGGERCQILLGRLVVLEKAPRRFRERPRERGLADLLAAGAVSCAVGLPGTLDQAAVGDARLDSGETGDILDRVEPPQGPDVADTGDGAPARQRDRIMAVGSLLDRALSRGEQRIVNVDPCQVHGHVLLHAGLIEALEEAAAVLGRGEAAQGFTEVMLAGGILDVRAPLCPLVHEMMAAAH
jgi:hypothetical protein